MKRSILSLAYLTGVAVSADEHPACPPFSGDVTVDVPNIFPESADFSYSNCKFYLSSLGNGSLIEFDPYTSESKLIELPEVNLNPDYYLCGVDYSPATGTIFIAASARNPWYPVFGVDLSGPNRLFQYSPTNESLLWDANTDSVTAQSEQEMGTPVGGFQETAEDKDGNAYFIATYGNLIVKVDPDGNPSPFYSPSPDDLDAHSYGFGSAFVTKDNVLVVCDAVSDSFVLFNLSSSTPSEATFAKPTGYPADAKSVLECDSLIAPPRYDEKVALCTYTLDKQYSEHGIVTVWTSLDGWKTSEYAGLIKNEYGQYPDVYSTASLATRDRVYSMSSVLPNTDGPDPVFANTNSTTLVDITDRVDRLVPQFVPGRVAKRFTS